MKKDGLDERAGSRAGWTRPDDYMAALARRRTARHQREARRGNRMDPQDARTTLGTIPFLVMMAAFALLAIAIAALAIPKAVDVKARPGAAERGTAPPGWIDRAEQSRPQR